MITLVSNAQTLHELFQEILELLIADPTATAAIAWRRAFFSSSAGEYWARSNNVETRRYGRVVGRLVTAYPMRQTIFLKGKSHDTR